MIKNGLIRSAWLKLTSPHVRLQDTEAYQKAYLLAVLLLSHMVLSAFAGLVTMLLGGVDALFWLLVLVLGTGQMLSYGLARSPYYRAGVVSYLGTMILTAAMVAVYRQHTHNLYLIANLLMLTVLISSIFYKGTMLLWLTVGVSSGVLAIAVGLPLPLGVHDWIGTVIFYVFFAEIILITSALRDEYDTLILAQAESISESEARFRALFDHTSEFIMMVLPNGAIADANSRTMRLSAWLNMPLVGARFWDYTALQYTQLSPEAYKAAFEQALAGRSFDKALHFRKATGELQRVYQLRMRPIYGPGGKLAVVVATFTNITAQVKAEARKQSEELRYRALFEQLTDGVLLLDLQERIMSVNPAGAEALGYAPAELHGTHLADLMADEDPLKAHNHVAHLLAGGSFPPHEHDMRRKDGDIITVEIRPTLVYKAQGEPAHIQTVFRDVTERKRKEREAVVRHIERERGVMFEQLIRNISHDMRTPLTNVKTSAYILGRATEPEMIQRHVFVINEAADHLHQLIESGLTLIRQDIPTIEQLVMTDVNGVVRQLLADTKGKFAEKGITCQLDLLPNAMNLYGDSQSLYTALGHILDNALAFTPEGGTVCVQTRTYDEHAHIIIKDSGVGIPPQALKKIFTVLYRGDAARTGANGNGLGLPIAQRVVTAHGGSITVESTFGEGSSFTVKLPLVQFFSVEGA